LPIDFKKYFQSGINIVPQAKIVFAVRECDIKGLKNKDFATYLVVVVQISIIEIFESSKTKYGFN